MRNFYILSLLLGCGTSSPATETPTHASTAEETAVTEDVIDPQVEADREAGFTEEDESLPEAPWTADAIMADAAPEQLVQAWGEAANKDWCAPLTPLDIGEARPRAAEYGEGWSVEFDLRGAPGLRPNGRPCATCGRGAFGIAGTAIRIDVEEGSEAEERRFRDGSYFRIETEEPEGDEPVVNVATIRVRGQECVYQVWTHAGAEALDALVAQLRFVSVNAEPSTPISE